MGEVDKVCCEGFEEAELRGIGMAVQGAVGLDERDGGKRAVFQVAEKVGNVAHVVGALSWEVGFIFEGIANGAVAVDGIVRDGETVAAAVVDPGDALLVQFVANRAHIGRRDICSGIGRDAVGIETLAVVDGGIEATSVTLGVDGIREAAQVGQNRLDARR